MFSEKEIVTYGTVTVFGVGALFVIDAYIKGIEEYVPIMLEMKR